MSTTHTPDGFTDSERYLARLCEHSFLSLWCYPSPTKNDGKELCDVLVPFGNDVLLFSDKQCVLSESASLEVSWARWYKKAVVASIKQLHGAERWLQNDGPALFADRKCTVPFPLPFKRQQARYHKIAVAVGAAESCQTLHGGSGSLLVSMGAPAGSVPYTVYSGTSEADFVHVFDEVALDVVMAALDTIRDFVDYLDTRKNLALSGVLIQAAGEEELLAHYLRNFSAERQSRGFGIPNDANFIFFDEGLWTQFHKHPQMVKKRQLDRPSYGWDKLIEHFNSRAIGGELDQEGGGTLELSDHERAVRVMAAESRFQRRVLASAFTQVANKARTEGRAARIALSRDKTVAYVFAFAPFDGPLDAARFQSAEYLDYRKFRRAELAARCYVAKHLIPSAQQVVGFASEPPGSGGSSEDLFYMDASTWTPDQEAEAQKLHAGGLFEGAVFRHTHHQEIPSLGQENSRKGTRASSRKDARKKQKKARRNKR